MQNRQLIKYYNFKQNGLEVQGTWYEGGKSSFQQPEKKSGEPELYYPDEYLIVHILNKYVKKHYPEKSAKVVMVTEPWRGNSQANTRNGKYNTAEIINTQILSAIDDPQNQNALVLVPFLYGSHHPGIAIDIKNKKAIYIDPFGAPNHYLHYTGNLAEQLKSKGYDFNIVQTNQQTSGKDGSSCGPILTASFMQFIDDHMTKGQISENSFVAPRPNLAIERMKQIQLNNAVVYNDQLGINEIMLADVDLWKCFFNEIKFDNAEVIGKICALVQRHKQYIQEMKDGWESNAECIQKMNEIKNFQLQIINLALNKDSQFDIKIEEIIQKNTFLIFPRRGVRIGRNKSLAIVPETKNFPFPNLLFHHNALTMGPSEFQVFLGGMSQEDLNQNLVATQLQSVAKKRFFIRGLEVETLGSGFQYVAREQDEKSFIAMVDKANPDSITKALEIADEIGETGLDTVAKCKNFNLMFYMMVRSPYKFWQLTNDETNRIKNLLNNNSLWNQNEINILLFLIDYLKSATTSLYNSQMLNNLNGAACYRQAIMVRQLIDKITNPKNKLIAQINLLKLYRASLKDNSLEEERTKAIEALKACLREMDQRNSASDNAHEQKVHPQEEHKLADNAISGDGLDKFYNDTLSLLYGKLQIIYDQENSHQKRMEVLLEQFNQYLQKRKTQTRTWTDKLGYSQTDYLKREGIYTQLHELIVTQRLPESKEGVQTLVAVLNIFINDKSLSQGSSHNAYDLLKKMHKELTAPKIVVLGDSTIDNKMWVGPGLLWNPIYDKLGIRRDDTETRIQKSHRVLFKTELSVVEHLTDQLPEYTVCDYTNDGFTTENVLEGEYRDKVFGRNTGMFPHVMFNPLLEGHSDIRGAEQIILSVGGNNFREFFMHAIFRCTSEGERVQYVKNNYENTFLNLKNEYIQIIQKIRVINPNAKINLMMQYYPSLTQAWYLLLFSKDWDIYNFMTKLGQIMGIGVNPNNPMDVIHALMKKTYQDIIHDINHLGIQNIVATDVTSAINPFDKQNHAMQIEPSGIGGKKISQMLVHVIKRGKEIASGVFRFLPNFFSRQTDDQVTVIPMQDWHSPLHPHELIGKSCYNPQQAIDRLNSTEGDAKLSPDDLQAIHDNENISQALIVLYQVSPTLVTQDNFNKIKNNAEMRASLVSAHEYLNSGRFGFFRTHGRHGRRETEKFVTQLMRLPIDATKDIIYTQMQAWIRTSNTHHSSRAFYALKSGLFEAKPMDYVNGSSEKRTELLSTMKNPRLH